MKIPRKIPSGLDVRNLREYINDIRDFAVSLVPRGDGRTINVTHGSGGVTLSAIRRAVGAAGGGGGSNVYPATIGAKVSGVKYACTVYKNGKYDDDGNLKSDGVAGSVFVIQVGTSETIPVGTWIMVAEFGGHYEGAIPIWL